MGIFDKKTGKPIDSDDLAKRVEEYNQSFLASQEPQKADVPQPPISTVKPITPPSQRSFDSNGFRIVSEDNQKLAKASMMTFVESIDNENKKSFVLIEFEEDEPSPELLLAATQYFNLTFNNIWNRAYSLDDMKYDVDKLSEYIIEEDNFGILTFMAGFPKYITIMIKKEITNGSLSAEDVDHLMAPIEWAEYAVTDVIKQKYKKK